ncbi:hypothetical protein ALC56_05811, partial [Trachymyrmex septentrionalis]
LSFEVFRPCAQKIRWSSSEIYTAYIYHFCVLCKTLHGFQSHHMQIHAHTRSWQFINVSIMDQARHDFVFVYFYVKEEKISFF